MIKPNYDFEVLRVNMPEAVRLYCFYLNANASMLMGTSTHKEHVHQLILTALMFL